MNEKRLRCCCGERQQVQAISFWVVGDSLRGRCVFLDMIMEVVFGAHKLFFLGRSVAFLFKLLV